MEGVSLSADKQQLSVSLPHLGLGDEVIPALVSAVEATAAQAKTIPLGPRKND